MLSEPGFLSSGIPKEWRNVKQYPYNCGAIKPILSIGQRFPESPIVSFR